MASTLSARRISPVLQCCAHRSIMLLVLTGRDTPKRLEHNVALHSINPHLRMSSPDAKT